MDMIYLDYRKAFDSVPHERLLLKLQNYGIKGKIHDWLRNFLTGRTMQVGIGSESSAEVPVISGVPQGSVLGPLLFLVYVNDFAETTTSKVKLFADDSKIYRVLKGTRDSNVLQRDLDSIVDWSKDWLLGFNLDKCKRMHVGHNNMRREYTMESEGVRVKLQETLEEKDLGVWITNDLKPSTHCVKAAKKASQALRLLKVAFEEIDEEGFNIMYRTFVRPHLEYAVQAWCPYLKKDIMILEKVQRRATKMVRGFKRLSYEERLRRLNLLSLEERRVRGDLIQVFKILKGIDKTSTQLLEPSRTKHLRGHSCKIYKPQARIQIRKFFFTHRIIDTWNSLPQNVVTSPTVNAFKTALDKWSRYGRLLA